ncbi:DNA glycosylase [Schizothecium vesticola]|uniref:DNA glycosylase n=1 Tax=Schizothecium vesticola TaxID=314040 RepID=A0AA40FC02_9PEZI|nr:DNA glycosylase [Schizothecium vesticola]
MASRRSARLSALTTDTKTPTPPPPPKTTTSRKRKAAAEPIPTPAKLDDGPSTPQRRKTQKNPLPPPETPTPAAVNLMAAGLLPKPSAVTRLASPTKTNAPLFSPETSRLIAPTPLDSAAVSPSKPPRPKTTSATILAEACAHLIDVDPRMKPLIAKHHCHIFSPEGLAEHVDPFEALASGIISQQVSGAAAKAIKARFVALFPDAGSGGRRFPQPSQVATASVETLRGAGLSQRKAEYLTGLAEKFVSGELTAGMLADAPYEEVLERLIAVRGLGRWSVEMFACFGLKRMDVFSLGDLGVQRGMAAFVGRDVAKLKGKGGKWKYMSEGEMEELSDRFRPYRSVFMWYMWRVEETDTSTME